MKIVRSTTYPPLFLHSEDVEDTGEATQETGEAVETVDTAGVVKPQPRHEARQQEEAQSADQASSQAQHYGKVRLQQNICYGADADSS